MKANKKADFSVKQPVHPILIVPIILIVLGFCSLVMNLPGIWATEIDSYIRAIAALCIIIGAIGIFGMYKWALYLLGFSIAFPFIFFILRDWGGLISFTWIVNLAFFIYFIIVYKAFNSKKTELKEELIQVSQKYIFYAFIFFSVILLTIVISVISCAFGYSKARGVTRILGLNEVIGQVQKIENK